MDCLLYDSQHGTYIVQHRLMTPGVWETAFTTLDFSAGTPMYAVADYQTTINTTTGWLPESMCLHGNGEYIVSGFGIADFSHYMQGIRMIACSCSVLHANQRMKTP